MLEPIPYYYDMINRNAIVVKPKQPLLDWANKLTPDEKPITETEEGNVYLIKQKDSNEAIARWLSRNFDRIFENELNDWWIDEKDWPKKRTFKLFKEWFDYEINSVVLDMEDTDIIKE